jgi:hypothetical protein
MAKRKVTQRTPAEQAEVLSKEIHPLGSNEAPAIQDMISKDFLSAKDTDAALIAKAVLALVKGELSQEDEERFRKYQEYADKRDAEARKFEEDKMKWWEEQVKKIESLKKTGFDKDKIEAKAADLDRQARDEARAEAADAWLKFQQRIATAPKVRVISSGVPIRVKSGVRVIPEVLRKIVGSRKWEMVLPVDEEVELPDFIANERAARSKEKRVLDRLPEQLAKMEDYSKVVAVAPEVDPKRSINTQEYIQSLPKVTEGD